MNNKLKAIIDVTFATIILLVINAAGLTLSSHYLAYADIALIPIYGVSLTYYLFHSKNAIVSIVLSTAIISLVLIIEYHYPIDFIVKCFVLLTLVPPISSKILQSCHADFRSRVFSEPNVFLCFFLLAGLILPIILIFVTKIAFYAWNENWGGGFFDMYPLVLSSALSVLVFAPITYYLLFNQSDSNRIAKTIVYFLSASFVFLSVFQHLKEFERSIIRTELEKVSIQITETLGSRLSHIDDAIKALSIFLSGSKEVTLEEFAWFAKPFIESERGISFSWNQMVNQDTQAEFTKKLIEASQKLELIVNNTFIDSESDLKFIVLHILPLEGNEGAVGYDIYSDDLRRLAIKEAIDSKRPIATRIITLVQNGHVGSLVIYPVSNKVGQFTETDVSLLKGVVVGIVDLDIIFNSILSNYGNYHIEINDIEHENATLVFEQKVNDIENKPNKTFSETDYHWAGRDWNIRVYDSQQPSLSIIEIIKFILPTLLTLVLLWIVYAYLIYQQKLHKINTELKSQSQILTQLADIQNAFLMGLHIDACLAKFAEAIFSNSVSLGVSIYDFCSETENFNALFLSTRNEKESCKFLTKIKQLEEENLLFSGAQLGHLGDPLIIQSSL